MFSNACDEFVVMLLMVLERPPFRTNFNLGNKNEMQGARSNVLFQIFP